MTTYILTKNVGEALQKGIYTSVPFNRSKTSSILLGSVAGLTISLPLENIADRLERFNYDVVDPLIVRLSQSMQGKTVNQVYSIPAVRAAAHGAVRYRYALAHAPLTLVNPIESLTWALASNKTQLFKDSALQIFKDLGISPLDIDLKRLFSTFADSSANVYMTVKNGLHGIKPKEANVNGTRVPLLSINEDQLAAIVPSYLGIVLGYILPLPACEVDDIHAYTMSQHSSALYKHIDSLNESTIIDTEQALAVASAIYKMRYRAIFATETIAHHIVYAQLTQSTSYLPPELYSHVDDILRDELADDSRDILELFIEEANGEKLIASNPYASLWTPDSTFEVPDSRIPQFGYYESLILEKIEEDMSQMARLKAAYEKHELQDCDYVTLENYQGRYYHLLPRNMNNVSMEDIRSGKFDKYRNFAVSQEGAGLLVGAAIIGLIAGLTMLFTAIYKLFSGSGARAEDYSKRIEQDIKEIREKQAKINNQKVELQNNFNSMIDAFAQYKEVQQNIPFDNRADRMFEIIRKYNPAAKVPKSFKEDRKVALKFIYDNLTNVDKINAVMLTRKDNKEVPQITQTFYSDATFNALIHEVKHVLDSTDAYLKIGLKVTNKQNFSALIKDAKNSGTLLKNDVATLEKMDTEIKTLCDKITAELNDEGAVNTVDVLKVAESGAYTKARSKADATEATRSIQESLKQTKQTERALSTMIEEALKRGELDDKEAKELTDNFKRVIRYIRSGLILLTRTLNTYFRVYGKVAAFLFDYKYLLDSIIISGSQTLGERVTERRANKANAE